MRYAVVSVNGVEVIRTDRRTAEMDVEIFKTIIGRKAWIEEMPNAVA